MNRLCVCGIFLLCLSGVAAGASVGPRVVAKAYKVGIAPSHITVPVGGLLRSSAGWRTTAGEIDLYKYYGVQLTGTSKRATPVRARDLVALQKREQVPLGCEFGDFPAGDKTDALAVRNAFKQIDPVFEAGGTVASLHLDGPVRRQLKGMRAGGETLSEVTQGLVRFFKQVHAKYPNLRIGLITNFPNWDYTHKLAGSTGVFTRKSGVTYLQAIDAVCPALKAAGQHIAFIEVDCPYNYFRRTRARGRHAAVDNVRRFTQLQHWCEQRGIRFHVILNSQVHSAKQFHDQTLAYVRALRRNGIFPDVFIVQSWYRTPKAQLPESKPNTFMNTARDAIALIRKLYPSKAEPGSP